jgi:hypothetical protein
MMKLTEADIEAGKSPKGGWTRKTVEGWGVPWPLVKGWKQRLLAENASAASPARSRGHPSSDIRSKSGKLTQRERYFLSLINPEGTIGIGTSVGAALHQRGFVAVTGRDRYGITESGKQALEDGR